MVSIKTCSFFGHRNTILTDKQYNDLEKIIEDLIVKSNVKFFLFGSQSKFDTICHRIVTDFKKKFPFIVRKSYTCFSETCTLEKDRAYREKIYLTLYKEKVRLLCVEEEVEHKTKYTAGKASYVERNQAMINDSDFCIFFYNKDYKPPLRKYSRRSVINYQPNSGTALAYDYALKKKKGIINIANF